MATEALKMMEKQLIGCTQGQLGDISKVDTHELGEAIDMIKDLSEAIYYCTITQSMEKSEKENQMRGGETNINYYGNTPYYYTPRMMYPEMRDMERSNGYMYYPGGSSSNSGGNMSSGGNNSRGGGTRGYEEPMMMAEMMRDPRQGRSPMRRRMYMEGKEMHKDTNSQLAELEAYLHELSDDLTEMIKDASPEEKATLRQKMTTLANKIN